MPGSSDGAGLPVSPETETKVKPKSDSLKCAVIVRDIPPDAYRLPTDGRQGRHKARQRKALAMQLATYADADGSRIWPGAGTLARQLGMSRRAVTYLLDDLLTLGFIENAGLTGERGTRIRKLNLGKMMQAAGAGAQSTAGAQSSPEPVRNLQDPVRNLHGADAQSSIAGAQSSIAHNRPALPPTEPPPPPPAKNKGRVVEGFIQTLATKEGMGVPGKKAREVLDKLEAAHGPDITVQVLKQFLKRPKGIDGLTQPWAVFITEADTWTEIVVRKVQEERARRVNQRAGGDELKKRELEKLAKLDPPLTPDEQAQVDKAVAVGEAALAGKSRWHDGTPEANYYFWWQTHEGFDGLCAGIRAERYKAKHAKGGPEEYAIEDFLKD